MLDAIGWVATAVFSISYLFKSGSTLRRVQALAAVLWIAYGIAISAKPVIVANLIVAISAIVSALSSRASPALKGQQTAQPISADRSS